MKILVIGFDCAAPELLLGDDRLVNTRRLMAAGCYGQLESVIPPITVPAWMCMATSQDPGSLGVYGFRNRIDHTYDGLRIADSRSIRELTIWDQIAREGGRSVVIGVPPGYPPRKVNGTWVGCFMTPDSSRDDFTHPRESATEIHNLVGDYPVDVKEFRTDDKERLKEEILDMTRKHFAVVRHFLTTAEWDYFQFVEIGLDRIHHGFWKSHDPRHLLHEPGNPHENVVRDYYRYLDAELGEILGLLDEETLVLLLSDHGARPLDGGFCINEWLIENGLLALHAYPDEPTPLAELRVDWDRTQAWGEGGYYGRIFVNVRDREPCGIVQPDQYERFRDELAERLATTTDPQGRPLGTRVYKPEQIYKKVNNIAPDLIVHFGDLAWRSVGRVGYRRNHVEENDTGPDDCNHAQHGAFVLAGPKVPLRGEITGAQLLDMAPTLLSLGGYDIPDSMQGKALGLDPLTSDEPEVPSGHDDRALRDRLGGLGYLG